MWPILGTLHPSMLDRVPVNIIDVPLEIPVITDHVLPIAALPNTTLTSLDTTFRSSFAPRDLAGKPRFDQRLAHLIVRIIVRQGPDAVEMLGKNDNRVNREWMSCSDQIGRAHV